MTFQDELKNSIGKGFLPSTIYKYRIWNDEPNDHILRKCTIKLASPNEFYADYSETILPIDESLITEERLKKRALYDAQLKFPNKSISYQRMKARQLRKQMKIEDPVHLNESAIQWRIRNDEILGIFCSSMTYEDVIMWERFADNATGFVVGLDISEFWHHPKIQGIIGKVDYYPTGHPPKVSPFALNNQEGFDNRIKALTSVPDSHLYENEIRIIRHNHQNGKIAKYEEGDRVVKLHQTCYNEILLGVDISETDKNEIIETRNELLSGVPIYTTEILDSKVIKKDKI